MNEANPPVRVRAVYLESTVTPQLGARGATLHPWGSYCA